MDMMGSFMRHGLKEVDSVFESLLQMCTTPPFDRILANFSTSVAGADTTATGIWATMLFVMTNPHVYKLLQAEIDNYVIESNLAPSQIIPHKSAGTLPYLQAVVREGLRYGRPLQVYFPR